MVIMLVGSCGDGGSGSRGPNIPPDTEIVTGPEHGSTVPYQVNIVWRGTDSDGRVDAYEIAWHNGFISCGDFDSLLSWDLTTRRESTFAAFADTCPEAGLCRHTQTFCVRAIDNDGDRDPEPAYVSFTATTTVPKSKIVHPPREEGQMWVTHAKCVIIRVEGTDTDGEVVEYRYGRKGYYEWPGEGQPPPLDSKTAWTEWTTATEDTFDLSPQGSPWSIYVHCRDNAGATETVFENARNHIVIELDPEADEVPEVGVCCYSGPCTGKGRLLGCRSTDDPSRMDTPIDVDVGDTLCFESSFSPGPYATKVTHIAYLVNDPGIPAYWLDASDEDNRLYPPAGEFFIVLPGISTVYVWARDDYCEFGSENTAYIRIRGSD